jgi:uncharacterized protein YdeI (YjbR/CyaY-like superfamily)
MAAAKPELEILWCASEEDWAAWLEVHHASRPGVWLKMAKKSAPVASINHREALETALCYGWIDGQLRRCDEDFFLLRFTPRGPRSRWSEINRETATRLIAEGRMRPAGLDQVRAAQSDGRWEQAYPPQSRAPVPPDFQAALEAAPPAADFFATLTGARRYAFLHRLHQVRDERRRAERIERYLELLSRGQTLN